MVDHGWFEKHGFERASKLMFSTENPPKSIKICNFPNWSFECLQVVVCCLGVVVGHLLLVVSK